MTLHFGGVGVLHGQAQNSAHQCQNMRLAQWSLFREDVRDLFGLTASNMSTYMVVGVSALER
eukprot:3279428-Amphidinium_carterae.1